MYSRFYVRNIGDYFGVFVFYDNADDTCDYLLLCPVLEREASAEGRASIFSVCTRIYYYIRGDSAVGKEYTFSLIEKAKKEDLKEILPDDIAYNLHEFLKGDNDENRNV